MGSYTIPLEAHENFFLHRCNGIHSKDCGNPLITIVGMICGCEGITSTIEACVDHNPTVVFPQALCSHCNNVKGCNRCNKLYHIIFVYDLPAKRATIFEADIDPKFVRNFFKRDPTGRYIP